MYKKTLSINYDVLWHRTFISLKFTSDGSKRAKMILTRGELPPRHTAKMNPKCKSKDQNSRSSRKDVREGWRGVIF